MVEIPTSRISVPGRPRRIRRWRLLTGCGGALGAIILLVRFGCGESARLTLGARTTGVIEAATRVESIRLASNEGVWGDDNLPLGGYRVDHAGPILGAGFTGRLRNLLFDARSN